MMKRTLLSTLAGLVAMPLLLLTSVSASAGLITVSDSQNQISDGQNFNFSLNASDYTAGSSSLLTLTVQGDFNSGASSSESLSVFIEGNNYGTFSYDSAAAYDVVLIGDLFNTYQFSLDFTLDSVLTNSFLADDTLSVLIDFGTGVTEQYGWSGPVNGVRSGSEPFATVSYTYDSASAIPEPSSLALLGLGLLAVGLRRKLG